MGYRARPEQGNGGYKYGWGDVLMPVQSETPPHLGYRPMPNDFAETFIRVGWDGIEAETRAHKTTIVRWIHIHDAAALRDGKPVLNQLRRQFLEAQYAAQGKRVGGRRPGMSNAARYVMGMRFRRGPAPTFFDAELLEDEK